MPFKLPDTSAIGSDPAFVVIDTEEQAQNKATDLGVLLKDTFAYVTSSTALSDTASYDALRARIVRAFCIEDMEVDTYTNTGILSWLGAVYGKVSAQASDAKVAYERMVMVTKRDIRRRLTHELAGSKSRVTEGMIDEELAYGEHSGWYPDLGAARKSMTDYTAIRDMIKVFLDATNQRGYALRALNYRVSDMT